MKKLHSLVALTLALTLAASSIYGQDPDCQEGTDYSSAYVEGSNTAHWSVYIPIAILVGAAIWFGVADRHSEHHNSSTDSQDGLGSIASSKRISSHDSYRTHSYSYGPSSSRYSPSSYLSSSYRSRKVFCGVHSH